MTKLTSNQLFYIDRTARRIILVCEDFILEDLLAELTLPESADHGRRNRR